MKNPVNDKGLELSVWDKSLVEDLKKMTTDELQDFLTEEGHEYGALEWGNRVVSGAYYSLPAGQLLLNQLDRSFSAQLSLEFNLQTFEPRFGEFTNRGIGFRVARNR